MLSNFNLYLSKRLILDQCQLMPFPLDQFQICKCVSIVPNLCCNVKIATPVCEYCWNSISDGATFTFSRGKAQQFSKPIIEPSAVKGVDVQVQGESECWTPGWECSQQVALANR